MPRPWRAPCSCRRIAPNAYDRARVEAKRNGYEEIHGVNDIVITPLRTVNATPRRLTVTISAPIGTFFMRVIGITTIHVRRTGIAEYTLPVPMGSPENYYGVFGLTRGLTKTETTTRTVTNTQTVFRDTGGRNATLATPTSATTGWQSSLGNPPTNTNMRDAIDSDNNSYAFTNVNNRTQQWGSFGFHVADERRRTTEVVDRDRGLEVDLDDVVDDGNNCSTATGPGPRPSVLEQRDDLVRVRRDQPRCDTNQDNDRHTR